MILLDSEKSPQPSHTYTEPTRENQDNLKAITNKIRVVSIKLSPPNRSLVGSSNHSKWENREQRADNSPVSLSPYQKTLYGEDKELYYPDELEFNPVISSLSELRNCYISDKVPITLSDLNTLIEKYTEWVKIPLYLAYDVGNNEYVFRLASKRGNSVYRYKTKKRLDKATAFFNTKSFKTLLVRLKNGKYVSNVFFITLTYNPRHKKDLLGNILKEGDRLSAWLNIQKDYNVFITKLRKKYGKIWILKTIESTKNGYPHIHLLAIFEKPINVFPSRIHDKKKNRVITRWLMNDNDNGIIKSMWASHIDIKSIKSVNIVKNYVYKDVIKQINNIDNEDIDIVLNKPYDSLPEYYQKLYKHLLSLSLNWLFKKHSFSVSGVSFISDLISECITQTENLKNLEVFNSFEFIGLVSIRFSGKEPPFFIHKRLSDPEILEMNECLCSPFHKSDKGEF